MNLDNLYKNIGRANLILDCLYPIYLLYPDLPIYEINHDPKYVYNSIHKHFKEILNENLQDGDLILFEFENGFHFGIYCKPNKFFHYLANHKLRLTRFTHYKKYVKGYFRRW